VSPPAPRILIVSSDRSLLRLLSRLLGALGYGVETATGASGVQTAAAGNLPPIVLVDGSHPGGEARDICRILNDHPQRGRSMVLVCRPPTSADAIREALESGADDVLSHPVVYCELLARLRAATRGVEWLRRAEEQQLRDGLTGLPNRAAFLQQATWEPAPPDQPAAACVLIQFDGFDRVLDEFGRGAADRLQCELATWVAAHCRDGLPPAALAHGRFAVWRVGPHAAEATAWADALRAAVLSEKHLVDGKPALLSVSIGIAPGSDPAAAAETLDQADDALQLALQSGRDQVVEYDEVLAEDAAWADMTAPSRLLQDALAIHVMVPCTTVLEAGCPASAALPLVDGLADEIVPVVDSHRRLVGVVNRPRLAEAAFDAGRTVADCMWPDPVGRDERTSLVELMKAFADAAVQRVVITRGGEPRGIVTSEVLSAMTHPATAALAEPRPFSTSVHYLCVPETTVK